MYSGASLSSLTVLATAAKSSCVSMFRRTRWLSTPLREHSRRWASCCLLISKLNTPTGTLLVAAMVSAMFKAKAVLCVTVYPSVTYSRRGWLTAMHCVGATRVGSIDRIVNRLWRVRRGTSPSINRSRLAGALTKSAGEGCCRLHTYAGSPCFFLPR